MGKKLDRLKSFFAAVGVVLTAFFSGIAALFLYEKYKKPKFTEPEFKLPDEDKVKEELKNEIENTNPRDLIKSSNNYSGIQSDIGRIQEDSTGRIRDKIQSKL